MPFEPPPKVAGDYVSMSDFVKLSEQGEVLKVANGFLLDEPHNQFKGEALPRYVIVGTVSNGDTVKVSCPNGKGYSRDTFLQALDGYLKAHPDETVDIKFVNVAGSRYVDIEQA